MVAGQSNRIVCIRDGRIDDVDVNEALAMKKSIDDEEIRLSSMLAI